MKLTRNESNKQVNLAYNVFTKTRLTRRQLLILGQQLLILGRQLLILRRQLLILGRQLLILGRQLLITRQLLVRGTLLLKVKPS